MILAAQDIRERCTPGRRETDVVVPLIDPFYERTVSHGLTFGLSACGYDIRIAERVIIEPGEFVLASSKERFCIPTDLRMTIHDKSSLARRGLAVQNTIAEPGWEGWLTLELSNHDRHGRFTIEAGSPIAQVCFQLLTAPTDQPYRGRYNHAPPHAQEAIEATDNS